MLGLQLIHVSNIGHSHPEITGFIPLFGIYVTVYDPLTYENEIVLNWNKSSHDDENNKGKTLPCGTFPIYFHPPSLIPSADKTAYPPLIDSSPPNVAYMR